MSGYIQINNGGNPNKLSFHTLEPHNTNLRLRLDQPLYKTNNEYHISYMTNPVKNDISSGSWTAVMLADSGSASGIVDSSDTRFGLLVRSNGGIQIFSSGKLVYSNFSFVSPADVYAVDLRVTSGGVNGWINGRALNISASFSLGVSEYLYLEAIGNGSTDVSWFDDLIVGDSSALSVTPFLRQYGYYFGADRYTEVASAGVTTNINWLEAANKFASCSTAMIWNVSGAIGDGSSCAAYDNNVDYARSLPDWNWNAIYAITVTDEPFLSGRTVPQVKDMIRCVKNNRHTGTRGANLKVFINFSGEETLNKLTLVRDIVVNTALDSRLDIVSMDYYASMPEVQSALLQMKENLTLRLYADGTYLPFFLVVQSVPNPGQSITDSELAALTYYYYHTARFSGTSATGLLNWGFWTHPPDYNLISFPAVTAAEKNLGAQIHW